MTNEYLSTQEIQTITGVARSNTQSRWLNEHGVPHQLDRKRVIVSRVHVQAWLEGKPMATSKTPNWAAVT